MGDMMRIMDTKKWEVVISLFSQAVPQSKPGLGPPVGDMR